MNGIHDYFRKYGIEEKNIPKAFIAYKCVGSFLTIVTYGICYRYRPLVAASKIRPFSSWNLALKNRFPNFYQKTKTFIDSKSKMIGNSRIFKPVATFFGLEPQRATLAIGENIIFDKLTMPIATPLQFWAAIYFLKSTKKINDLIDSDNDNDNTQLNQNNYKIKCLTGGHINNRETMNSINNLSGLIKCDKSWSGYYQNYRHN